MSFQRLLGSLGRGLLWVLIVTWALVVSSIATFVPISWLPGEIQLDFVNGHFVGVLGLLVVLGVLVFRLGQFAEDKRPPGLAATAKFTWLSTTATMLGIWPLAFLAWVNSYGIENERSHDMVVIGRTSTHVRPASTPVEHIRLQELRTGWEADLQPDEERNTFSQPGSCVRIAVREGRLGLDWISSAVPIDCPLKV